MQRTALFTRPDEAAAGSSAEAGATPPEAARPADAPAPSSPPNAASVPSRTDGPQPTLMQRIKDKLPMVEYASRWTSLKSSPSNKAEHFGKCPSPAHEDSRASFCVNSDLQVFHCKGCGIKGNVVGLYALLNGMSDEDAKFTLGRELGVVNERRKDDTESLLSRQASRYSWQLERKQDALDYLRGPRRLTDETIKKWGLGFCWGTEFKDAEAEVLNLALDAGLVRPPNPDKPGPPRSFMAGRITFPVKDRSGRIVGFGGRLVPSDNARFKSNGPKYLNTPETKYFHKSELLFGANEASASISKLGFAVALEGYMDVVVTHQEGATNTVGVMGASANEAAFESLWKLTNRVVFCLDGDAAGAAGAMRSVLAAAPTMEDGCEIAVARLPLGKDPDEYILEHGLDAWNALCTKRSVPLSRFILQERTAGHDLTYPEGRARFLEDAKQVAGLFAKAPTVREQIVAEARAINAAALVDVALDITGLGEGVTPQELRDAIALMQRRLQSTATAAAEVGENPAVTPAAPQRAAPRPR